MKDWAKIKFGDLYLSPSRNGINRPSGVRGIGYPMINMGEIFKYDRISNIEMERVLLNEKEIASFGIENLDLIFARQSIVADGAGKCSIVLSVPEITCFESHIIRVRLNKKIAIPEYFYYFFQSYVGKGYLSSIRQQGVQAGIRGSDLEKLIIPNPPLPTQRKIATILSAYDDLIENNLKRIKLLEESIQLAFSVLSNNPVNKNENVFPTYADFVKGSEPGSNSYSEINSENKIPFIRVGDLGARNSNIFIEENIKGLKIATKQDILISMDATIGVVKIGMTGAYSSGIRKVVTTNELYKGYLYAFLKSKNGQDQIMTYAKGSTILHASSAIPKLKVRIPNINKSKEELNGLNKMLNLIINLSEQNEYLKESRDILLPRLMSGVIEIK
jgi:type I restriction enzyme S subunit